MHVILLLATQVKQQLKEQLICGTNGPENEDDVKRTIACGDDLKEVYETCAFGKQTSKIVPNEAQNKSQKHLELVYPDILGPFEMPSLNGSKYAITFVDD